MNEEKKDTGTKVKEQTPKKVPKEAISVSLVDVPIMFREQRKFDLHVGREMIVFRGRETKYVPEEWIEHPDFVQVSRLFVIRK